MNRATKTEVELKNVITVNYIRILLLVVLIACSLFLIAGIFIYPILGLTGLTFSTFLILCLTYFLVSKLRKNLSIHVMDGRILITDDRRKVLKEISRDTIAGFYTYDYLKTKKSLIYFKFFLKDGKKLEIIDSKLTDNFDPTMNKLLNTLIDRLKNELDVTFICNHRLRSFLRIGNIWYGAETGKNING